MPISITNNYINNSDPNATSVSSQHDVVRSTAGGAGNEIINVKSGQTIQGEVVSKDGNNVTLKLSDGQMINAKLAGNASISVGKLISFEVQNPESGNISLRPLFSNLSNSSTVGTALTEASLEHTQTYIKMTSAMMDAGMSIDKNSISQMARDVNAFPLADPASIVEMTKLGLPIDELNVTQYENYKNFEHQIIKDVDEITEGVTHLLTSEIANGSEDGFKHLAMLLSDVDVSYIDEIAKDENLSSDANTLIKESKDSSLGSVSNAFSAIKNAAETFMDVLKNTQETPDSENSTLENVIDKKTILKSLSDATGVNISSNPDSAQTIDFLKKALDIANNPNIDEDLKKVIKTDLTELFSKQEIKEQLIDAFKSQLTLHPDKIAKDGEVTELFNRIMKFSQKVIDIAGNYDNMNKVALNAQNLQDNVNFMNQLNQFVNYVQLPLKMYQEDAHGELYVYSKHKNLSETDGNINALLHLDMDHLGPMDVYVSMKNYTNVSTNFRLANEDVLDFIEKNIHLLDEALKAKGYNMTTNVTTSGSITGQDSPITDEFFKKTPDDEGMKVISKMQFDVRA